MKFLYLGNSNEVQDHLDPSQRRPQLIADSLAAALGEPVEARARAIWPNTTLPERVRDWVDEYEPDLVYLNVITFWFTYESMPLKLERMFGKRVAGGLKEAGKQASRTPWLGHTAAFHAARRGLTRLVGGATFFEPEQVVDSLGEVIRVIVRKEHPVLVVKPAFAGRIQHAVSRRARRNAERRRMYVQLGLKDVCKQLRVEFIDTDTRVGEGAPPDIRIGDRMHLNSAGASNDARAETHWLLDAWQRHTAVTPPVAATRRGQVLRALL